MFDGLPTVLSAEELRHFDEHGFVRAKAVISLERAARTARDVVEFAGREEHRDLDFYLAPHDRDSWYDAAGRCGFKKAVELYHSQAMWDNRLSPRMHSVFAQLYGTTRLLADKGRCSITPPSRDVAERQGLHWDIAALFAYMEYDGGLTKKNLPKGSKFTPVSAHAAPRGARTAREGVGALPRSALAAVLYLTDVAADGGAFTCVPGFHRRIDHWLDSLPADIDGRKPWTEEDLLAMGPVAVPGQAGDVIVWNSLLPHGAGVNRSNQSRIVQYVALSPLGEANLAPEALEANRRWHAERLGSPRLGMPPERGAPTIFHSERARCLAGLDAWPGNGSDRERPAL